MSAPDFELPLVEAPFHIPPDSDPQSSGGLGRDGGVLIPPAAGADQPWTYVPQALLDAETELGSAILNLVPVVGQLKGLVEAFAGKDLITGRHLEWWERALNVAVLIPEASEFQEAEEAVKIVRLIEEIQAAIEAIHKAHHLEELGEAVEHAKAAAGPQPAAQP